MDLLADVLRAIRLSGGIFFNARLSSPWAFASPSAEQLAAQLGLRRGALGLFHALVDGHAHIRLPGQAPIRLDPGTLIVLPRGDEHVLASHPAIEPANPISSLLARTSGGEVPQVAWGTGTEAAHFICGYLHAEDGFNPLIGALPHVLVADPCGRVRTPTPLSRARDRADPVTDADDEWLQSTLRFAAEQAVSDRPGTAAVLARVFELLYIEVLRRYAEQLPEGHTGWLAGVRHRDLGRALRLLHEQPARNWTVTSLGREIGMSRSALATRFRTVLGIAPMSYLALWRVQLAQHLLREHRLSLSSIASAVGYGSEAAFHRAFKRHVGTTPAQWRSTATRTGPAPQARSDPVPPGRRPAS